MTKKELTTIFMDAKKNKSDVCVELTIPGQSDTEFIINKNASIENKLNYYLEFYDDELKHKNNSDIQIIYAFELNFYIGGR